MKLNERAIETLKWADLAGITPKYFSAEDRFVHLDTGEVLKLGEAPAESVVWIPNLDSLGKVLERAMRCQLRVLTRPGIVLLVTEFLSIRVEGAGASEQEAVLHFLERLRDAYQQRVPAAD